MTTLGVLRSLLLDQCNLTFKNPNAYDTFLKHRSFMFRNNDSVMYRKRGFHNSVRKLANKFTRGKYSPQQVSAVLQRYEETADLNSGAVKSFQVNRMPANNPIEDRDAIAFIKNDGIDQHMFGVFDGHGGYSCSQTISERLFHYIAVTMASEDGLEKIRRGNFDFQSLLQWHSQSHIHHVHLASEFEHVHREKLVKLATEMLSNLEDCSVRDNLISAFTRLDEDIMLEAVPSTLNSDLRLPALQAAFEGSCGCVAFIDKTDLYIANTGDCRAVLGVGSYDQSDDNMTWKALPLSNQHDAYNSSEIERLVNSHPNEQSSLIKNERLLGVLAPLRAFGDAQFKWSIRNLNHVQKVSAYNIPSYSHNLVLPGYRSPPYLTAEPEVTRHKLNPKDKFLVIASDGLWEFLSPDAVVQLVGGHTLGMDVAVNFQPHEKASIGNINGMLKKRKIPSTPIDDNIATHLLRNAMGPDHQRISTSLSIPAPHARSFRDDISIIVIHFDSEYIKDEYEHRSYG